MTVIGHLINGQMNQEHERLQDVYNPSTGEVSKQVALAGVETVEKAISAAQAAYPAWRDMPVMKRVRYLFEYKNLLEKHRDELCELIGSEHGKILHDAAGELQRGIEVVEFACGAPELLKGEFSKNVGPQIDSWSDFQPLGVVAGITPFNFPAMVPLWMFPLAIACGNTFILKPSERDPSVTLRLVELLHQTGIPEGVVNVVNGDKLAVDTLLTDKRVQAISFVGSTPIARYIYTQAAENGKRCQALGGAKNHAIVLPDADLDNVVNSLLGAAYGSCGERCMALSVAVVVGNEMAERMVKGIQTGIQSLKVGPYHDNSNHFGPLISPAHHAKVKHYIDSAEQDGAHIVVDGRTISVPGHENGFYLGATLIDHVRPEMLSYQEEIFGPVLQVVRVDTMQQAMDLIEQHIYGNGTCIYTRDGEAARYFADKISVGMVGINIPLPVPVAYHSFGGWKQSRFGDLGTYGPDGVRFYTRRKTITQRWPTSEVREGAVFSMPTLG